MSSPSYFKLLLLILLLFPSYSYAQSFVRTETCGALGGLPCARGEHPKPIYWKNPCVLFYINEAGSIRFSLDGTPALPPDATQAVVKGFYAWNHIPDTKFEYHFGGVTNETEVRWDPDSRNINVILWRDQEWSDDLPQAIALTSVSYSPSTGQIFDADIELNTKSFPFTFGTRVQTDLQNTIAHEAGHFLGLAHTKDPYATMFGNAASGETSKRDLNPTDIKGIQAIYPSFGAPLMCHFPQKLSRVDVSLLRNEGGCCSTTVPPKNSIPSVLLVFLGLIFLRRKFA